MSYRKRCGKRWSRQRSRVGRRVSPTGKLITRQLQKLWCGVAQCDVVWCSACGMILGYGVPWYAMVQRGVV